MISNDANERDVLAGEYVLGLLSRVQAEELESRLFFDADLRDRVDAWEVRFAPALVLICPVAPERSLWERIESIIKADGFSQATTSTDRADMRRWVG